MNKKSLIRRKKIIMDAMKCKEYTPMRAKELAILLEIPKGKRKDFHEVLDQLMADGSIEVTKRGKYQVRAIVKDNTTPKENKRQREEEEYVTGLFIGHPKGFGFVELPEEEKQDIFIPEPGVQQAVHQDEVQVRILDGAVKEGKRKEGTIVKIIKHNLTEVVGTYQSSNHFGFVVADNRKFSKDIFIATENSMGAINEDKVVVTITNYGSTNKSPEGKVTEILGHYGEAGVDVLAIAKSSGLPMEFPEKVIKQTERVAETIVEADFYQRMDLRDWTIVTIDGEDAKDLDDGISLTEEDGIYHLGVHIADVSNYVQYHSALDREAIKRGTSVYLVDRVIPMLPQRLSNGICSLNQGEDRLSLSCLMDIDQKGTLISHQIVEAVINVNRRMTYTSVKNILEKDAEEIKKYEELVPLFLRMKELSALLRKKRHKRGSIDFDFPESKIILDEKGKPIDVYASETNVANEIIEDFMLMANETVAEEFQKREIPFLYRTHDTPDPDKMEAVLTMLHSYGVTTKKAKAEITPKEVQKILKEIEGTPSEPLFSRLILRSMKQARYTVESNGHFGLAAKYYCHFTSPIRRYPDLQIHRIIKEQIHGKMTEEKIAHYKEILEEVARQSSAMERRAEEVERETIKLKKAEYMMGKIGETFQGRISGVTEWGMYVELPSTVEGLAHVSNLRDDYYSFNKELYQLVGERTNQSYGLGQEVTVRVEDADLTTKTVDFVLADEEE